MPRHPRVAQPGFAHHVLNRAFGDVERQRRTVERLGLESTLKPRSSTDMANPVTDKGLPTPLISPNRFELKGTAKILIDPTNGKPRITLKGAYGHEQRHVKNFIDIMNAAKAELEDFEKKEFCSEKEAKEAGAAFLKEVHDGINEKLKEDQEHKGKNSPPAGHGKSVIGTMPKNPIGKETVDE